MDAIDKDKNEEGVKEITKNEIISLLSINNVKIKDEEYVKKHIVIERKSKMDSYEIQITDIDGKVFSFRIELKTYP